MADACTLTPVVRGSKSKLYQEIKSATGSDLKLTNFIYALSLQKTVRDSLASSDFNFQGEPKLSALNKFININDILDAKSQITAKSREIGAVNSRGDRIYHEDPASIINDVIAFNEANDNIKASIKYSEDGYYIIVDGLNAENFNTNSNLKYKLELFDEYRTHLKNKGLNINVSDSNKSYFNAVNVFGIINTLNRLKIEDKIINPRDAALIVDLFKEDPFIQRLLNTYDEEDLALAISETSGYATESGIIIEEEEDNLIKNFLSKLTTQAKRINNTEVVQNIIDSVKEKYSFDDTIGGTSVLSIKETLKSLYDKYGLDKESLNALNKKVKTVGDAAKKLEHIQLLRAEEYSLKTGKKYNQFNLAKIQRMINNAKYYTSIIKNLELIVNQIDGYQEALDKINESFEENHESLTTIRKFSKLLLQQLDDIKAYDGILKEIIQIKSLKNDSLDSEELVEDIITSAKEIQSTLADLEHQARNKQYEVVKTFLQIYWGNDKVDLDGNKIELSNENGTGIMDVASHDVNFFDKFLYAASQTNDEMINILDAAVRDAKEKRDAILLKESTAIRQATNDLFKSGESNTHFMFETDENGNPSKIISDFDYARLYEEFDEYKKQIREDGEIDKKEYNKLEKKWLEDHMEDYVYEYTDITGKKKEITLSVPIYKNSQSVKSRLNAAQYTYWKKMMDLKASKINRIIAVSNDTLFDVIEMSTSMGEAIQNAGFNINQLRRALGNKVLDATIDREDDVDRGTILEANDMVLSPINAQGDLIQTLPIFYTHKIKNRDRVTRDFSKAMTAFCSASNQYIELNKIIDALLLTKEYMLNQRKVNTRVGGKIAVSVKNLVGENYTATKTTLGRESYEAKLINDYFDAKIFSKSRADNGKIGNASISKLADSLVGYTSITGLALNGVGGMANALVGKLQMLIDAGAGEFFNFKDYAKGSALYWAMLVPLLGEINSITKSSKLGLLMQKFDVEDDFYEKAKSSDFYKNVIARGIFNANVMVLYGMGEHMLHAQTMLAILNNKKNNVLNEYGKEVPLLDAFEVKKNPDGSSYLAIKEGYTMKDGSAITEDWITKVKNRIHYANTSMHGAFGGHDKGMAHRYAIGRLIMNFRQWMPAHYARRFRGQYYDSYLDEYREGFYVSAFKFAKDCLVGTLHGQLNYIARYDSLTDVQKANCRRAFAEAIMVAFFAISTAMMGPSKDHKGNWARRSLLLQMLRMRTEVYASSPLATYNFFKNIITILNSPMACINTATKMLEMLKLWELAEYYESGKYKGENKYLHNLKQVVPIRQVENQLNIANDNALFSIYEN